VQTRLERFPQPDQPAVVGVSSFGFGGTKAHVVLADAPKQPPPPRYAAQLPLHPVCLSARTPEALNQLAQAHLNQLKEAATLQLANLAASANSQRSRCRHRAGGGMVAVLAPLERLQGWLEQGPALAVAALNGPNNTAISGPAAPPLSARSRNRFALRETAATLLYRLAGRN
jgi:acyl transferase domain-containing protein